MQKKKFNVVLFILLLFICVLPGIIYLVAYLTQPSTPRKYTHNGYVSKLICGIIWTLNSAIITIFIPFPGALFLLLGIGLIVLASLGKKNNKKLYNIIYLVIIAFLLVWCFMGYWFYLLGGFLASFIFGIVGPIRGLKYVGPEALEALKAEQAAQAEVAE